MPVTHDVTITLPPAWARPRRAWQLLTLVSVPAVSACARWPSLPALADCRSYVRLCLIRTRGVAPWRSARKPLTKVLQSVQVGVSAELDSCHKRLFLRAPLAKH